MSLCRKIVGLIQARLQTMTEELWRLVRDGSKPVATHAVFAATVKYSPLLGDFLDLVVRKPTASNAARHGERSEGA